MSTAQAPLKPGKPTLRRTVTAQRQARPEPERVQLERAIAAVGLELPRLRQADCVAGYLSLPEEPGTRLLRAGLRELGIRVLLPIVAADPHDRRLDWAEDAGDLLTAGPFGLPQPPGPRFGPAELGKAQVVIVPALAVDTLGTRLGRGRGYYDAALGHAHPEALILALVHDREVLDGSASPIPREPHDHPVHAALTPTRWMFFSPPPPARD